MRVLHGEAELAEAVARAEESAKRLQDRLAARAARDARTAAHAELQAGGPRGVASSPPAA